MNDQTNVVQKPLNIKERLKNITTKKADTNGGGDAVSENNSLTTAEDILSFILEKVEIIRYHEKAGRKEEKLLNRHYQVILSNEILSIAMGNNLGVAKQSEKLYVFNGSYWMPVKHDSAKLFLSQCAEKSGVDKYLAQAVNFRKDLTAQLLELADIPKESENNHIAVNLENGTFEFNDEGGCLREFRKEDFFTYKLPFKYDPQAKAPMFQKFLGEVIPEVELQMILAEFFGSVFIPRSKMKIEKGLVLYGSGANGKSVVFEIITALLGKENVSSFPFSKLTEDSEITRGQFAGKLLNYGSEISPKINAEIGKSLISGEPVPGRHQYGNPFLFNPGKIVFNANDLPITQDQSHGWFRRLIIIPFDKTIPEAEQDQSLGERISTNELSGIFNWILEGMKRLIATKGKFTYSETVKRVIAEYKEESSSVVAFINENGFVKSDTQYVSLQDLYSQYQTYCVSSGCKPFQSKKFSKQLVRLGFKKVAHGYGAAFYITQSRVL